MYISLHNHSDGSLLDGYQTVQEMVSRAKSLGMPAISLTDHGTMRNIIRFYEECTRDNIKPIVGCEFYFCPDVNIKDHSLTHHLVLLAMNDEGYMNLKRLDTFAYDENSYYYKPRIDWEALQKYSDGLICLSACMASIVNTENGEEWFKRYKELFQDRFYAEIQPLNMEKQWKYNDKVIGLARKYNVPLVVTTDAHYSVSEDRVYHSLWIRINNHAYHNDENYIWSEDEIRKTQWIPKEVIDECIENTERIAERCNVVIPDTGSHYPKYPCSNPKEKVREICRSHWKDLVPKGKYKEYAERFEMEMKDLEATNYLEYLLIIWSVLSWCKEQNIPLGEGRGSSAGCLVGYLMGIHKIDPIKYHTEFFRFCNKERRSPADVDSDISTLNRGRVIEHVREMYGNVCKVQTLGYTKDPDKPSAGKEAVLKAWQALANKSYSEAPKTKKWSDRADAWIYPVDPEWEKQWEYAPKYKIEASKCVVDSIDDLQGASLSLDEKQKAELIDVAKHFCGRIDKIGVHASAVLVTPDDLVNYTPVEGCYSNDTSTGKREYLRTACYSFHELEQRGNLKLDLLGLNTLDLIDKCMGYIGKDMNLDDIPMDDKQAYDMYSNGNLDGVFQMESPGMRKVAKELHVSCFGDVAALVALYRPGPLDSGMMQQYIDGKNGASIDYLCDAYKEITKNTFGVIVYQEQCMKLAMKMAGYSLGEADMLRKVIGRKEMTKIDAAVKEFISRCMNHGYSKKIAEKVGMQIKAAGRYLFNKSHSVAYGRLSYKTAYLKAHYPVQFMCALLNTKNDNQDKVISYLANCKEMGIKILPPDFSVGNKEWQIEGNCIRVGLTYIKGVGKELALSVQEETNCDYSSLTDWNSIVEHNNSGVVKGLIQAGALDFLNKSRGWMMSNLSNTQKYVKRLQQCKERIGFYRDEYEKATNDKERARALRMENQWAEKRNSVNFVECKEKPLDKAAGEIATLGFSFSKVPDVLCGVASSVHEITTKNGNKMALVTFMTEDYGTYKGSIAPFLWGHGKTRYGRDKLFVEQGKTYEFMMKKNKQYMDIVDVKEVC